MASLFDTLFGSPDEDKKQRDKIDEARRQIEGIPDLDLGEIDPVMGTVIDPARVQGYDAALMEGVPDLQAATYDPALMSGTAFDSVQTDPRLRQAQLDALAQMQDVAAQGGLTQGDRARLAQIEQDTATADRGRREAILQNMNARGMGGSSQELLAQLQSAQAATDQANQQGLGVAAMAQDRALDAIANAGKMAGGIRGQDFGEQGAIAEARDALQRFNVGHVNNAGQVNASAINQVNAGNAGRTLDVQSNNQGAVNRSREFGAGAQNAASLDFTGRAQRVSSDNTATRNAAQVQNRIASPTAEYEARTGKAKALAGQSMDEANYWGQQGDRKAKTKAGLLESGVKIGTTAMTKPPSDERKKTGTKGITKPELEEFFAALKPKTFNYKDPSEPGALPGLRVGFIAQDVKDTELGKDLVSKDDEGMLRYDPENLQGILLAALKEMGLGEKKKGARA